MKNKDIKKKKGKKKEKKKKEKQWLYRSENLAQYPRHLGWLIFHFRLLLRQRNLLERSLDLSHRVLSLSLAICLPLLGLCLGFHAVQHLCFLHVPDKLLFLLCRLADLGSHAASALSVLSSDLLCEVVPF